MASLSHGLLSAYEEKLYGIYYVSFFFLLFFPLIPSLFYAHCHGDLVQQMSTDFLLLQCVTGVQGMYDVCVCFALVNTRHRDSTVFKTFHCLLPSPTVDKIVLSPPYLMHVLEGDGACY